MTMGNVPLCCTTLGDSMGKPECCTVMALTNLWKAVQCVQVIWKSLSTQFVVNLKLL